MSLKSAGGPWSLWPSIMSIDEVDDADAPIDAHMGWVDAVDAFDTFDRRDCGRDDGVDWDSVGGATPSNWWWRLAALYLAAVSYCVAKSYAEEKCKFTVSCHLIKFFGRRFGSYIQVCYRLVCDIVCTQLCRLASLAVDSIRWHYFRCLHWHFALNPNYRETIVQMIMIEIQFPRNCIVRHPVFNKEFN